MEETPVETLDCDVQPHEVVDVQISTPARDVEVTLFKCNVCDYGCNVSSDLKNHKLVHSEERTFKCDVCDFASNHLLQLYKHRLVHSIENPYKCDICNYSCKQLVTLIKHNKRIHNVDIPKKCTGRNQDDSKECKVVEKRQKCNVCTCRLSYERHNLIHSGIKPHKCGVCSYTCRQKSDLQKRKLDHSKERTFKCDVCDFTSNHLLELYKHRLVHNIENPYKCDFCACKLLGSLKRHKITHYKEKVHKCNVCNKTYHDLDNINKHELTHSGFNLLNETSECHHKCIDCKYNSISVLGLRKHLLEHVDSIQF